MLKYDLKYSEKRNGQFGSVVLCLLLTDFINLNEEILCLSN